jgi:serine/threonine protein kinase/formylglycine-generating enzyme required for sulfatase activity/Flp pilus assembly protein TadD
MHSVTPPNRELLAELLLRWEDLYERGQDTPAEELARDHPDLIVELARRIRALKTVAWIQKPLDDDPPDDEPAQVPADPKTLANRYRLDELIAEGGFARVYRAYDQELQRTVAVKVPKPERLHSGEAFLAEARRVARLKHDGIVAVYDCGLEGGSCFIVSEYLDGGSLADRIVKQKPSREEAVRWVAEVAEALEFAHLNGVVHRDLKPANILIDQHGRAKLADFGIAQSATKTGEFAPSLGTLRYMAPEGLQGNAGDHRSDIFSLGIVLHEALTGRIPYSSYEPTVLRREIIAGRQTCSADIPEQLRSICRKALSHSPHQRHASAAQFAAELRRAGSLKKGFFTWAGVAVAGLLMGISLLALWKPFTPPTPFPSPPLPIQPPPPLEPEPEPSGRIALSGFGDQKFLTGSFPSAWQKPGVFAEIKTPGKAEFPVVHETAYVVDCDLEIRSPKGRLIIYCGEPAVATEVSLGNLWEPDSRQDKVACRFFRDQPFGVNWWGETHFSANQRMTLTVIVADDYKALVRDGLKVLGTEGDVSDFRFTLVAHEGADAVIHSVSCRPLTAEDAKRGDIAIPIRKIRCDIAAAKKMLDTQRDASWLADPQPETPFMIQDLGMVFRWISPGEFTMGKPDAPHVQLGANQERVQITRGYWIAAHEVTQGQWSAIMGTNPSRVTGSPYLPVNNVSWSESRRFCEQLTALQRAAGRCPDGYEYRLPTEAEWEYACRAGSDEEWVVPQDRIAFRDTRVSGPVEVGATPANSWGLHEMQGNVAEWCLDEWRDYRKPQSNATLNRFNEGNPSRSMFVVRGSGFWITEVPPTAFVRTRRYDIAGGFRGFRVGLGPTIQLQYPPQEASPHEILLTERIAEAKNLFFQGKHEAAESKLTEVLEQNPTNADALNKRGICRLKRTAYKKSIEDFTAAMALTPDDPVLWKHRAIAYGSLREFEPAIRDFTKTLELDPNAKDAREGFGATYSVMAAEKADAKQFQEAAALMDKAIAVYPESAVFYHQRGSCFFHMGEFQKAIADLNVAIGKEPTKPDHYENRALSLQRMGRHEEADADFEKAKELRSR